MPIVATVAWSSRLPAPSTRANRRSAALRTMPSRQPGRRASRSKRLLAGREIAADAEAGIGLLRGGSPGGTSLYLSIGVAAAGARRPSVDHMNLAWADDRPSSDRRMTRGWACGVD